MDDINCYWDHYHHSFAESEFGCPLDHCQCGKHDPENLYHKCPDLEKEMEDWGCPNEGSPEA